nr:protein TPR2-like isoform X1 [Tanacetum cinerariifolium]
VPWSDSVDGGEAPLTSGVVPNRRIITGKAKNCTKQSPANRRAWRRVPSIAGPLGPIPNASSSMASAMERERMQTPLSIGNLANAESSKVVDIKPRIVDNADKTKTWKLPEIVDSSNLRALRLPDPVASSKVCYVVLDPIHFVVQNVTSF